MSLTVLDVLTEGIRRTLARNGLVLVLASYVLSALYLLFVPIRTDVDLEANESPIVSPAVCDSVLLGAVIAGITVLLIPYVAIVAYRTFTTDETETVPRSAVRHRPVWAYLNVFVGGIVFLFLVMIGSIFFLIPGLFLLVSLWFFDIGIAVEDDNAVAAFRRSWGLTSGNRLRLFAIGGLVFVVLGAVSVLFAIPEAFVGDVAGILIAQVASALGAVYVYATTAVAYTQLQERHQVA